MNYGHHHKVTHGFLSNTTKEWIIIIIQANKKQFLISSIYCSYVVVILIFM
jgi:hypothetical protein